MSLLRLQADDPEVLTLTRAALEASLDHSPDVTIRCQRCRAVLGYIGWTSAGPLFTARWSVPDVAPIVENGKQLTVRQMLTNPYHAELVGDPGPDSVDGVIALLALPPGHSDFPDLMVRCNRDGDAVLDRAAALRRLRDAQSPWEVAVSMPRLEYRAQDHTWLEGTSAAEAPRRHTITRTFGRTIRDDHEAQG